MNPELSLLVFMSCCSMIVLVAMLKERNLFSLILLNNIFSLFTVVVYLALDAPDVAMTECLVGLLATIFVLPVIKHKFKNSLELEEKFNPYLFGILLIFACALIYTTSDLPKFGSPVFDLYYLNNAKADIDIPSVVTAILAGYRGYDTLLETLVILVAGMSVLLINNKCSKPFHANKETMLQLMTRLILPLILLFAFYLQFHGEVSPGGGFQAGVMIASAYLLYCISYGKSIPVKRLKNIAVLGVLFYLFIGLIGLMHKTELFNYNSLARSNQLGQQLGIMLVELGVGVAVSATLLTIFVSLTNASNKS